MRYGLVGTGYWAAEVHTAALADAKDVEFVGVWGRDPAKAATVAEARDVRPYDDVDAMFADVDAVAFAVPPDVQADVAVRAARAGCHLLLEKPVALTAAAALDTPGNPFGDSPWRREHGALWDIGPHMLSLVLPVLGPVEHVRAAGGPGDTVHVALRDRCARRGHPRPAGVGRQR